MKRRLGIFACYLGESGNVDEYILFLLREMRKYVAALAIVCNGEISGEGKEVFNSLAEVTIVRANEGFDACAWQCAMRDVLGWEQVQSFDELILFNDSFFGPIYPLDKIFEKMDGKNDFWGLTCHYQAEDVLGLCPYGYLPDHIQTYFLVIDSRMLKSTAFCKYWDSLPKFKNFNEVVRLHEAVFTRYFADMGYTWGIVADNDIFARRMGKNLNPYICEPYRLLTEYGVPILKKKNFSMPLRYFLGSTSGNEMYRSLEYISKYTNYDTNIIWDYILRHFHISDIYTVLGLSFVIGDQPEKNIANSILNRAVIVVSIKEIAQLNFLRSRLCCVPKEINIIVICEDENVIKILQKEQRKIEIVHLEQIDNDFISLLQTILPYIEVYDYICILPLHIEDDDCFSSSLEKKELVWDNILGSQQYILNLIALMEDHPRMGVAFPPVPVYGTYMDNIFDRWKRSFSALKTVCQQLEIIVPLAKEKQPIMLGNAFWCRRQALLSLGKVLGKKSYLRGKLGGDVLEEAMARIIPFAAQQAGFYSAGIMNPRQAIIEARNSKYMLEILAANAQ